MLARGCGGLKLTTKMPFTASNIEDFKEVVNCIHKRYPDANMFGMGFSLGACLILKYASTHGPTSPLRSIIAGIYNNVYAYNVPLLGINLSSPPLSLPHPQKCPPRGIFT